MRRALQQLRGDTRGVTVIEFAIVAPVMLILIMGLGDVLYQGYVGAVLSGAVQKAGRDSGLEGANPTAIDATVQTMVRRVIPGATFPTPVRKSYDTFTQVAPEPFVDGNNNGRYDPGECYTDQNANSQWDADPGVTGQGGASAVTLYTVTVTYRRLFPVAGLIGLPQDQSVSATTLLKNQPYSGQSTTTAVQRGTCS